MRIIQVSHLKCRKCAAEFDYSWVLAFSVSSIRLGNTRYLRCPSCHSWLVFNIIDTRIDATKHHC
jgi:DNA-directed RNA polymerase subunit RPC12/RpoP